MKHLTVMHLNAMQYLEKKANKTYSPHCIRLGGDDTTHKLKALSNTPVITKASLPENQWLWFRGVDLCTLPN